MANIFVDCPYCHQKVGIRESDLGYVVNCPLCQKSFVINKKDEIFLASPIPIKCKVCGKTEFVKQDGMFVCLYCQSKYSIEEAKNLLINRNKDDDNIISEIQKFEDKEKLTNLYSLAEQAFLHQKYEEALNYYKEILIEQPNHWQPVFYTSYLQYLCTTLTLANMGKELESLRNGFSFSVKILTEKQDSKENINILKDLLNKILDICYELEAENDVLYKKEKGIIFDKPNIEPEHNRNKNSIAILYSLLGDVYNKYLYDCANALIWWKKACILFVDKDLRKKIIAKIHFYDSQYNPPSNNVGCLLRIVNMVIILSFFMDINIYVKIICIIILVSVFLKEIKVL